jgi:hypothetical protein
MCDDTNNYFIWSKNKSKVNLSSEQETFNFFVKILKKNTNKLFKTAIVQKVFL